MSRLILPERRLFDPYRIHRQRGFICGFSRTFGASYPSCYLIVTPNTDNGGGGMWLNGGQYWDILVQTGTINGYPYYYPVYGAYNVLYWDTLDTCWMMANTEYYDFSQGDYGQASFYTTNGSFTSPQSATWAADGNNPYANFPITFSARSVGASLASSYVLSLCPTSGFNGTYTTYGTTNGYTSYYCSATGMYLYWDSTYDRWVIGSVLGDMIAHFSFSYAWEDGGPFQPPDASIGWTSNNSSASNGYGPPLITAGS